MPDGIEVEGNRNEALFRTALGKTGQLSNRLMGWTDVWYMVRRCAADFRLEAAISCHTFRATGITDYLINGGKAGSLRSAWLAIKH